MTRVKAFVLTTIGLVVAVAALGLFASIGLVVLGGLAVLAIAAGIASVVVSLGHRQRAAQNS